MACEWLKSRGPLGVAHGNMLRDRRVEPEFVWTRSIHIIDPLWAVAGPLKLAAGPGRLSSSGADIWRLVRLDSEDGPAVPIQIMPNCGWIEEHLRFAGDGYCVEVWTGRSRPWRVASYRDGERVLDKWAPAAQPQRKRCRIRGVCRHCERRVAARPLRF